MYGAGGRVEIVYLFDGKEVNVVEKEFRYLKPLAELKDRKDVKLVSTNNYSINKLTGDVIGGKKVERAKEIFMEMMRQITLSIK
jgi:hypothetical protein